MNTVEIANAVGKDERTIRRWIKKLADKMSVLADKMSVLADKMSVSTSMKRKVPDSRFGKLNAYHETVLHDVFQM